MDLATFHDVDLSTLRWTRVHGPPHTFQLSAGDTAIARLVWSRPHGSLAIAETADGRWSLKRAGFLHAHLTVRREGSDKDVARLVAAWRDHRIELSGGEAFDLKRASMLVPAWTVLDARTGGELVHIEPVREGRQLEGGIYEVAPAARTLAALPLVLALSWYFVVLAWFEDETVSEWADHAEGRF
jgi:hypothetical protein